MNLDVAFSAETQYCVITQNDNVCQRELSFIDIYIPLMNHSSLFKTEDNHVPFTTNQEPTVSPNFEARRRACEIKASM